MQLTEQYIEYLLKIKTENKNIDYKEAFNWLQSSKDKKLEIMKDILSMANTQNGGKVIFGVRDNDYELVGLSQEDYDSFDTTKVNDLLHQYSDPNISCQVYKFSNIENKRFVVIDVPEFQEVPILCKKEAHSSQNNKQILRKGQLYIRTEKGSSEMISSSEEMRELLSRATAKNGEELVVKIENLINVRNKVNIMNNKRENLKREEGKEYRDLQIRKGLKGVLEERGLTLIYQPKANLTKGIITGIESTVVWNHPLFGTVYQDELLQHAEQEGIVDSIWDWFLKTTCNQYKLWQDEGYPVMNLNINVFKQNIENDNFISKVIDVLSESNLNPQHIGFEVREADLVLSDKSISTLEQLNRLGLKIVVDNFGTGYSSLNYLKKLPISALKIDKSFVQNTPSDFAIVSAITSLALTLNFNVIADGVETIEQLSSLKLAKCEEYQGLLLSKPLTSSDFEKSFNTIKHIANSFIGIKDLVSVDS